MPGAELCSCEHHDNSEAPQSKGSGRRVAGEGDTHNCAQTFQGSGRGIAGKSDTHDCAKNEVAKTPRPPSGPPPAALLPGNLAMQDSVQPPQKRAKRPPSRGCDAYDASFARGHQ